MSKAQTYAVNVSRLLDNLGAAGSLSLAAMQLRLPRVVEVAWRHTGDKLTIGKDTHRGAEGDASKGWPACTRVKIEGQGAIAAEVTFYYRGYGNVTVRGRATAEGKSVIAFPVPLPDGWKYPEAAGRLTNMSRLGEFS